MNFFSNLSLRLAACAALAALAAVPLRAAPAAVRLFTPRGGGVPEPESLAAQVSVEGRTSTLLHLEIAAVGQAIPRTFSRHLIGNTDGFEWYVSRHFALKTDLKGEAVRETLTLLELGLPHLDALFGQSIAALADRRMAFVFASNRAALLRAMVSDDMHVLRLGGITQEGYWGAYQYAGSPYQNRYIILHEFAHLFQYCLVGNTRHFYGFFIEGVADFFSSHVYDPAGGRLTVNVLDRAPMHNHLAAGLAEWIKRGRPALSTLYEAGGTTRGLDVLMTAFFQSTPEWEQKWRIFCDETMRTVLPDDDPKPQSDRLIATLYGDWPALDAAFAVWMARQPSFVTQDYGFDQAGDTLVGDNPEPGQTARLRLHPPPLQQPPDDPFVRDYPAGHLTARQSTSNAFTIGFTLPGTAWPERGTVGFQLGAGGPSAVSVGVSNRTHLVIAAPALVTNCLLLPVAGRTAPVKGPIHVRLAATERELLVSAAATAGTPPLQRIRMPLTPAGFETIGHAPVTAFATAAGLRIVPEIWDAPTPASTPAATRSRWRTRPLSSRFNTHPAALPLSRAVWRLSPQAPAPLLFVRNVLLADALPGAQPRLTDDELEAETLWKNLAAAVQTSRTSEEDRNAALCDLAGVALDVVLTARNGPHRGAALARLIPPAVGGIKGRIDWLLDERPLLSQTIRVSRTPAPIVRKLPLTQQPFDGARMLTARVELQWLDARLTLTRTVVIDPGIPRWHVLGPFLHPDADFANIPFPPEDEPIDRQRIFTAPDGTLMHWQRIEAPAETPPDADHLIHFANVFRRQANFATAYAAVTFGVEQATAARLSLGATDGLQVWVNGVCVFTDLRPREWAPGNVRIPIDLRPGANTVLIKTIHGDGLWFLSGRIEDRDGRPLRAIAYAN